MDTAEADSTDSAAAVPSDTGRGGLPSSPDRLDEIRDWFARKPIADSTRAVYRRHWRAFVKWCDENGRTALPASETAVQDYAIAEGSRGLAMSTIRGRLAAVRYVHRDEGHEDPTASERIEHTLGNLSRETGTPAEKKKALRAEDIAGMVRALPGSQEGGRPDGTRSGTADARFLRGVRDRALILVGFGGALRRSELAGIRRRHVTFNADGFELTLPRSKGDQEGEGAVVGINRGESVDLCPRRALQRWIGAATIEEGPIFRPVPNHGIVAPDERAEPISGQAVADAVKRAAEGTGLDTEKISGHSLRRGHLTTAARNGAALPALQKQARHADPRTTAEYIEDANRMETSTSRHLGL
jgi:integrase